MSRFLIFALLILACSSPKQKNTTVEKKPTPETSTPQTALPEVVAADETELGDEISATDTLDAEDMAELSAEADDIRQQIMVLDDDSVVESTKVESKDIVYEIPVVTNRKVNNAIKYFTERERGRRVFQVWLERGHKYEDMIRRILREEGVPSDLYYLGMIESGYNPRARSWASAVGPWQFIKATGKAYGLQASYWADDRRDVENATRAAARHLRDLHKRFGDWYLAMAGYNCNPAKIARRVRQQGTKDYFKLRKIPRETKGYVPNFLATMIIAKNLDKYGFKEPSSLPVLYDRIYVKDVIDLNHIATAADTSYNYIRDLNPAITKWVTPSDRDSMYVNVPQGTAAKVLAHLETIPDSEKRKYIRYRIKVGDALSLIAQKYGVRMSEIRRINKMRNNSIREGKYLTIPVPANEYHRAVAKTPVYKKKRAKRAVRKPASTKGLSKVEYTVKSGDSLGEIAEIYDTKAQNIRDWNGLSFRQSIRVGQTLAIWVPKGFSPIKDWRKNYQPDYAKFDYHKVGNGDSLWDISKKYNVPVPELKKLNKLATNSIKVGSYLIIKAK